MKSNATVIRLVLLTIVVLFTASATSALAMNEELIGAVMKTDQGVALSTDSGEYLILGRDLKNLTGETVAITGDVEIGAMTKTIHVTSVKLLTPEDVIDPPAATSPMHKV